MKLFDAAAKRGWTSSMKITLPFSFACLPSLSMRVRCIMTLAMCTTLVGGIAQAEDSDAPAVVVHRVATHDVQPVLEFPTRIRSGEDIKIIPRVEGNLLERRFHSGDAVKQGDLLYVIEPKPFEIALDQRQAALDQARINLTLAKKTIQRAARLEAKKVLSTHELDQQKAAFDLAGADMVAAERAVERATLELGHTRIAAKADGVISHEEVAIGDLVGPTRGSVGTLDVIDSVRAYIHVDEKLDTAYYQRELAGDKAQFDLRLRLSTGDIYPLQGRIAAWDAQIDPSTGTRTIKLLFPNTQTLLTPGMSATVLITEKGHGANLAIPQQAVQQDQLGHYVLVLGEGNILKQRHLTLGAQVGNWWLVNDGLVAGESIVVEGLQQVRPGIHVRPEERSE